MLEGARSTQNNNKQKKKKKKQNRTTRNVRAVGWGGERSGEGFFGGEEEGAVKKDR